MEGRDKEVPFKIRQKIEGLFMKLIIDLDSYVYAAGFVAQKTIRYLYPKGSKDYIASFNSAKDRDAYFKELGYPTRKHWQEDFEEKTHIEPMSPQKALDAFKTMLDDAVDKWDCENSIAFMSSGDSWRKELYPEYKANRIQDKPIHYWTVEEVARKMCYPTLPGYEADDMVIMEAFNSVDDWVICGQDKDLRQIPGTFWDPVKQIKEEVSLERAIKNFWTQVLTGDRGDNIPGLDRIGPKTAASILEGLEGETEIREAVEAAYHRYGQDTETMDRNATLLYLSRFEGDRWEGRLKM